MNSQIDESFSAALRGLLVEQVHRSAHPRRWWSRHRRWAAAGGAAIVLAAGGGGIAYATGAFTHTLPGGDALTDLVAPVSVDGVGTQVVKLGRRPEGATSIHLAFTCLSAGEFGFADGSRETCDRGIAGRVGQLTNTMKIPPGQASTEITAPPHARWRLLATWVSVATTAWAVNASGQTYGVQNQNGSPDLVAAEATDHRAGYVYASQLNPPPPRTLKQALAQNNASPRAITVYRSDGKTPIGKFYINRSPGPRPAQLAVGVGGSARREVRHGRRLPLSSGVETARVGRVRGRVAVPSSPLTVPRRR